MGEEVGTQETLESWSVKIAHFDDLILSFIIRKEVRAGFLSATDEGAEAYNGKCSAKVVHLGKETLRCQDLESGILS